MVYEGTYEDDDSGADKLVLTIGKQMEEGKYEASYKATGKASPMTTRAGFRSPLLTACEGLLRRRR